jgi:glycosyltransferase involved in cell wall biosynthesis
MRILLITDNYPPETNASALRCSGHAQCWAEAGHDVSVVTSFPNFPDGAVFPGYRQSLCAREEMKGVSLLRVPTLIFPNAGTVRRILDFVSFMVSGTVGALFLGEPDVVVATSPQFFAAVGGWAVSFLRRRPFVLELRDLWPDSIIAVGALKEGRIVGLIRRIEDFLYRKADLIVTVTNASRDTLVRRGVDPRKITVVLNGVHTAHLRPGRDEELRRRLGIQDKVVVSYIGTLGMAHGLDLLLDAAGILQERAPDIAFLLVGSGAQRNTLRKMAAARGLANTVFVDRVPHDEVQSYWRASDIGLALLKDTPLFRTVIPSKVFEAMATGTPIISNVAGELETLLAPLGTAVHIDPSSDAEALAAAIEALAADPERRRAMGEAGLRAAPEFERERQAERMLKAISDMLAARAKLPAEEESLLEQER